MTKKSAEKYAVASSRVKVPRGPITRVDVTQFKVMDDMPIPPQHRAGVSKWRGLAEQMKVQSCIVLRSTSHVASLVTAIKSLGWEYTTRTLATLDGGGIGVWRTK